MPITVDCPSCNRKLRVPDDLQGKKVKCPTCGTTFTAGASAAPPPAEEEERPAPAPVTPRRPAPPDEYDEEPPGREGDDEDRPRPRRSRASMQPHRGPLVLILGILSLVLGLATGFGWVLGPVAWILGNNDLKEMRAGRMDPEGEGQTNAGRICGIISTVLFGLTMLCVCGIFALMLIGAIAGSNQ
jgi:predicted Zn finger-like uncharacterized protein